MDTPSQPTRCVELEQPFTAVNGRSADPAGVDAGSGETLVHYAKQRWRPWALRKTAGETTAPTAPAGAKSEID